MAISAALTVPAATQLFDFRFPFLEDRARRQPQPPDQRPAPPDNSKAPPPRKLDTAPLTSVVVLGDSMADWLAYGLELAAAESPDIGIVRRHRTWSGLLRTESRSDRSSEHPDWAQAARDILSKEKADFVVMVIGLSDRRPIRERPPARSSKPPGTPSAASQATPPSPQQPASKPADKGAAHEEPPPPDEPPSVPEPEQASSGTTTHEFRSDKWATLYAKRIDETIAALKTKNVPVFWVGLPPIRGTKSTAQLSYLNDLYRSRAEKAGITYIDVWDGFVDEAGRFVVHGPDFDGQTRRLRSADGVHFTQAGARKFAHYVEREIQRAILSRATPVALPAPEEPVRAPVSRPGTATARPLAGPVMPLTAAPEAGELLGGASGARAPTTDAIASRVLVRGEPVNAPAGRADDFVWPRRSVAPVGSDPVVATTTLPMMPMQPERQAAPAAATPSGGTGTLASRPPGSARQGVTQRRSASAGQQQGRRYATQPSPPPFFFPFFGRW